MLWFTLNWQMKDKHATLALLNEGLTKHNNQILCNWTHHRLDPLRARNEQTSNDQPVRHRLPSSSSSFLGCPQSC